VLDIERRRGAAGLFGIGRAMGAIGMAQHNRGAFDSAEVAMRASVEAYELLNRPTVELVSQLYSLSTHLISKGKVAEAQPVLQRALEIAPRALPSNHALVMQLGMTLADVKSVLGDTAAAHRDARKALALIPSLPDGTAVQVFITQWWYARMLRREQQWSDAEAAGRTQFESGKRVVAAFPHYLSDSYWLLGAILSDVGKYAESEQLLRESVTIATTHFGAESPRARRGMRDRAVLALRRGDRQGAEVLLSQLPGSTADSARQLFRARLTSR
jgi:tetratricopeptide (TPR) repeat protein